MTLLCPRCFRESGLKRQIEKIRPTFPDKKCSFHPRYKGIPATAVAEIVDMPFRQSHILGAYDPYLDACEGSMLGDALQEFTECEDDEIASVLIEILVESDNYWPPDGDQPFYLDDQCYDRVEQDDTHHSWLWDQFCSSIRTNQRFFNSDAKEFLEEIFCDIHLQSDHRKKSPIYRVLPSDQVSVFRARSTQSERSREEILNRPSVELSSPPERKRRAGRMNPSGIASFYGALDIETCIAELRPIVGSVVVGAEFKIVRPLYFLDTTRFEAPPKYLSPFIESYLSRMSQWRFMQRFMSEIAKPISPNDEHIDYIPTQAVAEYLLHHYKFKRSGKLQNIEAILFQSAQYAGGKNIVFLGPAARLETRSKATYEKSLANVSSSKRTKKVAAKPAVSQGALSLVDESVKSYSIDSSRYTISEHFDDKDLHF